MTFWKEHTLNVSARSGQGTFQVLNLRLRPFRASRAQSWRDARILVMLLINPSRQGYSSSANSVSKFTMSVNFVSNSANLSSLRKLCQQFSKSDVLKQIMSAIQQICLSYKNSTKACMKTNSVSNSANQQFFCWKSKLWFSWANLVSNSAYLLLASKLCQQFFCRCQQHDYSADISLFLLSRQRMEMILFRLACFFLSLQLTTYCQTFQVGSTFYVLPQYSSGTVFVT